MSRARSSRPARPKRRRGGRVTGVLLALLLVAALGLGGFVMLTRGGGNPTSGPVGDTAAAFGATSGDVAGDLEPIPADSAEPADPAATPSGGATTVFVSDSAAGDAVYRGRGQCLSCHGARGEGVANLGPALGDPQWLHGDGSRAAIEHVVAVGVSPPRVFPIAMPAYADQLTADQIRQVAAYVFALSHPGVVVPDTLPTRPDSIPVPADTVPRRR